MNATTWLIIAIVGFSLSGIALAAAVFIFIKLNVPAVIGDLTGKTVAKEIKAIRAANASSGDKIHKPSRVNINRGKLTEKVANQEIDSSVRSAAHASKRLDKTDSGHSSDLAKNKTGQTAETVQSGRITESFSSNVNEVNIEEFKATEVLVQNKATEVLTQNKATEVLYTVPETEVLYETRQTEVLSPNNQTEVLVENDLLTEPYGGTMVLSEPQEDAPQIGEFVAFKVTRSVVKIHTDEVV